MYNAIVWGLLPWMLKIKDLICRINELCLTLSKIISAALYKPFVAIEAYFIIGLFFIPLLTRTEDTGLTLFMEEVRLLKIWNSVPTNSKLCSQQQLNVCKLVSTCMRALHRGRVKVLISKS